MKILRLNVSNKAKRPRIYLAGKIRPHDWRHDLIPGLRDRSWADGPLACDGFDYVGPFFVSCSHRCAHGPATHGAAGRGCSLDAPTHADVFRFNQAALASADFVVAYINGPECYGTLFELGWAYARGIPVVILFAPGMDQLEFWYARHAARRVTTTTVDRKDLPGVFGDLIRRFGK